MNQSTSAVEIIVGYSFRDRDILWRALHAAGAGICQPDGQKVLAMIGDAVLKLVLLVDLEPTGKSRNTINNLVEAVINNQNLGNICVETGLAMHIVGNPSQRGAHGTKTLTATIEAVIGAVYCDSGNNLAAAKDVMEALGLGSGVGSG